MGNRILALLCALFLLGSTALGEGSVPSVGDAPAYAAYNGKRLGSLDDLAKARIGVQTGTTEGKIVEARFPEATVWHEVQFS
jgi:ABC-type amino acid transport substrate-binding protein